MSDLRTTGLAPEPALLASLGATVRGVASTHPSADTAAWAREIEEANEEIRRFKYEFGPLIEQAAIVQRQLRCDPGIQELGAAGLTAARVGGDGFLSPDALELGARLLQIPAMTALGSSAASLGCKGMGFLTANVEAALIIGGQAGAELVWLWPYSIGTYRTPNRVVGRAWYTVSLGLDVGLSLTAVPFPLDLSFWFIPPENTDYMLGAFLEVVTVIGARVELFGWVPGKSAARPPTIADDPELSILNPFKYIYGFRIVAEGGLHAGIGVAFKGTQVASNKALDLATYSINPSAIQAGKKYDGTAGNPAPLEGIVTAPQRDEQPLKTFKNGSTTLRLSFPGWMCTAMSAAPALTFKNDGAGGTSGWSLTNTPSLTSLTYEYEWAGTDDQAWQAGIDFTIAAYSNSTPPKTGMTLYEIKGLGTVGMFDVPVSTTPAKMSLASQVFSATGDYTLTVDTTVNAIEDFTGDKASGDLRASTSSTSIWNQNDIFYIPNPDDTTKSLIIDYTGTDKKWSGRSWYACYQFRQQDGTSYAQFRALFWQVGTPAIERNFYAGNWQTLQDPSQKYTSTATWSGGIVTNSTTLGITLTPSPS